MKRLRLPLLIVFVLCVPSFAQSYWIRLDQETNQEIAKPLLTASDASGAGATSTIPTSMPPRTSLSGSV